jgi:hypothetical protein
VYTTIVQIDEYHHYIHHEKIKKVSSNNDETVFSKQKVDDENKTDGENEINMENKTNTEQNNNNNNNNDDNKENVLITFEQNKHNIYFEYLRKKLLSRVNKKLKSNYEIKKIEKNAKDRLGNQLKVEIDEFYFQDSVLNNNDCIFVYISQTL